MKIRNAIFIALLSTIGFCATAQSDLVKSVKTYIDAYIDADVETLFFLTHPNIVSMGGGKEYVLEDIRGERKAFDNMNMDFLEGMVGTPSIAIESNDELQIVVPITYIVMFNDEKYKSNSSLFAGSSDGGETWRFINLDQHDKESLKIYVPNLSDDIKS